MSDLITLAIPTLVLIAATAAFVWLPREQSLWIGVTTALTMAILVPSFATSGPVAVVAVVGTIAALGFGLARDLAALPGAQVPVLLLGFITWSAFVGSMGSPIKLVLLNLATGLLLALLVFGVMGAARRGHKLFLPFFAAVLAFEFLIGFGEEFLGTKALWPRADGTDNISHRVNAVLPSLVGRAMGSTAQPIPYGVLIGFCLIACVWFAIHHRSRSLWLLSVVGFVGMVFSGTRSAILALAATLALWTVISVKWRPKTVFVAAGILALTGVVTALVMVSQPDSAFFDSVSFVHRAGVISTAGDLLLRSPVEVTFGSGYASIETLISSGIVHGVTGINVFDQEYVRTFAALGIVGFLLLCGAIVRGFMVGSNLSRLLIVFLSVSFLAFDGLSWRLTACLFVFVIANGYGVTRTANRGASVARIPCSHAKFRRLGEKR